VLGINASWDICFNNNNKQTHTMTKKLFSKNYYLIRFVYDKEVKNESVQPMIIEAKAQKFVEAVSLTAAYNKIKKRYPSARQFSDDLTVR
jgi:hypothetical protein